ncbi:MAG: hypothetical protein K2Y08_04620 [Alphaproteobacteria bacterium]|nr:hypothetical protein [Alphaproteobacteria bacterium]
MVRKSYYVFVFTLGLTKMDPVFSYDDVESACLEDSVEKEESYFSSLVVRQPLGVSSLVVKEENTGKSTELKKSPKKRGASCFFLRKRKSLKDVK